MPQILIQCPKCGWEPDSSCRWVCDVCDTRWNTFDTRGCCPGCGKVFLTTSCFKRRGGCGLPSPHDAWYFEAIDVKDNFTWFWQKKKQPPVTAKDKDWIERSLLALAETFDPIVFRSFITITPDNDLFTGRPTGNEEYADHMFEQLASVMNIDTWEIRLMFYSNQPTKFSEGIIATPQEKLKGGWKSSSGHYVDNGIGNKQIWIELEQLNDPQSLIATLAHQLVHYKLLTEHNMTENNGLLTGLAVVAYGFGIFMGNSHFKFVQWTGTSHQGWRMQKRGYLPEQVIAYAMAWLAHYRSEDILWKHHLNKTMKKLFEQSYRYIAENKDKVLWA